MSSNFIPPKGQELKDIVNLLEGLSSKIELLTNISQMESILRTFFNQNNTRKEINMLADSLQFDMINGKFQKSLSKPNTIATIKKFIHLLNGKTVPDFTSSENDLEKLIKAERIKIEPLEDNSSYNEQKIIRPKAKRKRYDNARENVPIKEDPFKIKEEDALQMAELTRGYPFAFQVLGYLFWNDSERKLQNIINEYDQYLEEFVYKKIWSELSDKDRVLAIGISKYTEPVKIRDIISCLKWNNSTMSLYKDRLKKKGILDTSTYGYVSFTLPRFEKFINSNS